MNKLALVVALSFAFLRAAHANLEGNDWVFHTPEGTEEAFPRIGDLRGSPLVSLDVVAKRLGLDLRPVEGTKKFLIHNPKNKEVVELTKGRTTIRGSWGKSELSRAPEMMDGQIVAPIDIGDRLLRPLLTKTAPEPLSLAASLFENDIILDPGHGGNDYGTYLKLDSDIIKEKDLVLDFTRDLKKSLEDKGLKVATTRDKDVYLTLHERTLIANRQQARLFLSFHMNADPKQKAKGFEIYLLSLQSNEADVRASIARENQIIPKDLPEGVDRALANLRAESHFEESLTWAKKMQKLLAKTSKPFGKGIKMGPFYVLYGVEMPALLVELWFLSDETDRMRLMTPASRRRLADSLAIGLAEGLKKGRTTPR